MVRLREDITDPLNEANTLNTNLWGMHVCAHTHGVVLPLARVPYFDVMKHYLGLRFDMNTPGICILIRATTRTMR